MIELVIALSAAIGLNLVAKLKFINKAYRSLKRTNTGEMFLTIFETPGLTFALIYFALGGFLSGTILAIVLVMLIFIALNKK